MASSAFNFATLEPDDLPLSNVAVDIYVIKNQDVILSQFYHNDTALNWQFHKFVADFKMRFCQTISVTRQNYNQILVLRDQQFSFVDFNLDDMFLCKNSTHLAHIAILFSQIIEQENSFLLQLTSFQVMLQNAEIITSPSIPKANNNQNLAKRNVVQPFSKKKSLFFADLRFQSPIFARNKTSDVMTKVKRSIGDIFTPYSGFHFVHN